MQLEPSPALRIDSGSRETAPDFCSMRSEHDGQCVESVERSEDHRAAISRRSQDAPFQSLSFPKRLMRVMRVSPATYGGNLHVESQVPPTGEKRAPERVSNKTSTKDEHDC